MEYRDTDIEDKTATSSDLGVRFSDWITLTEGTHYFVEATLAQGVGSMNINVGMEIQPNVMPSDHSKFENMV